MNQKILEITEKLYQEGVEKGEQKAQEILIAAEVRARSILEDASREADKILTDTKRNVAELKINMDADIRLSATQALSALKQHITDSLLSGILDQKTTESFQDGRFIKETAAAALLQWQKQGLGEMELLLPEQQKESLEAAFKTDAQTFLRDRCTFRFSDQIQTGFQVVFRAGKYKISFTDDDFNTFLKGFLRPRAKKFLFGE